VLHAVPEKSEAGPLVNRRHHRRFFCILGKGKPN